MLIVLRNGGPVGVRFPLCIIAVLDKNLFAFFNVFFECSLEKSAAIQSYVSDLRVRP